MFYLLPLFLFAFPRTNISNEGAPGAILQVALELLNAKLAKIYAMWGGLIRSTRRVAVVLWIK